MSWNTKRKVTSMNQKTLPILLACCAILAAAPSLAQDEGIHRPVSHPRPAPFRAGVRFVHPGFHPLHSLVIAHRDFAHFSPVERAAWTRGQWLHRWYHGRYGWWWNAGGVWFWYDAPVYPYPTVVSDYYYEDQDASQGSGYWYYCGNPAGYYPYVRSCRGPWEPVTPQPPPGYGGDENGPDQGGPPDQERGPMNGPPPQYYNEQGGPPPDTGRDRDQGPPAGMEPDDQGPPPDMGQYDQGPPPGYDEGAPPNEEQGPHE